MAKAKRKTHHSTHHAASHHSSGRHSSHRSSGRNSANHGNGGNGSAHGRHVTEEMVSAGREEIGRMQKSAFDSLGLFSGPMAHVMEQNWSVFQKLVQTMQGES